MPVGAIEEHAAVPDVHGEARIGREAEVPRRDADHCRMHAARQGRMARRPVFPPS